MPFAVTVVSSDLKRGVGRCHPTQPDLEYKSLNDALSVTWGQVDEVILWPTRRPRGTQVSKGGCTLEETFGADTRFTHPGTRAAPERCYVNKINHVSTPRNSHSFKWLHSSQGLDALYLPRLLTTSGLFPLSSCRGKEQEMLI